LLKAAPAEAATITQDSPIATMEIREFGLQSGTSAAFVKAAGGGGSSGFAVERTASILIQQLAYYQ
jgi:hypothetical protein